MLRLISHYARMNDQSNPPKQRGCFFYGCLTLAVIGLLVIIGGVVGVYMLKKAANRLIAEYTDTAPTPLKKVEYPPDQIDALRARLKAFKDAIEKGTAPTELVLTADDLNALITVHKDFSGKAFLEIEDDKVKGSISLPLEDLGPLKLKGRYLNGAATLRVSLENGFLSVNLDDLQVKGKPLPDVFMKELKKENLAKDATRDPDVAAAVEKIESLQVKDGKVTLRSTSKTSPTQERAPPPP